NALVDAGTFLAILLGTIAGGLLAPTHATVTAMGTPGIADWVVSAALVAVAVAMYLCARAIPPAAATDPTLKVNFNPFTSTLEVIRFASQTRSIFLSL